MKRDTKIAHAGSHPARQHGAVNPPVYRVSTVIHESISALEAQAKTPFDGMHYGRYGTPTTFAFEEALAILEGGYRSIALPSGLAAITTALGAFVKAGDHLLVADSVYFPTRKFCDTILKGYGVETTYYDPLIGAGIERLIQANTKAVFVESPGSITFEIQDIPAIAKVAHAKNLVVLGDNTWGTPLYMEPFALGIDVSIQACTKYIVGHADAMLGAITTTEALYHQIKNFVCVNGFSVGSEENYLGLRGLRTLGLRLAQHQKSAIKVAGWLSQRPEVLRVIHPALPGNPGHELWKRDFSGSCGLFSFMLKPVTDRSVNAFLDALSLFGKGYSWGGFESLAIPAYRGLVRTATNWNPDGKLIRLHIGLEDVDDLIADLEKGLAAMVEYEEGSL